MHLPNLTILFGLLVINQVHAGPAHAAPKTGPDSILFPNIDKEYNHVPKNPGLGRVSSYTSKDLVIVRGSDQFSVYTLDTFVNGSFKAHLKPPSRGLQSMMILESNMMDDGSETKIKVGFKFTSSSSNDKTTVRPIAAICRPPAGSGCYSPMSVKHWPHPDIVSGFEDYTIERNDSVITLSVGSKVMLSFAEFKDLTGVPMTWKFVTQGDKADPFARKYDSARPALRDLLITNFTLPEQDSRVVESKLEL